MRVHRLKCTSACCLCVRTSCQAVALGDSGISWEQSAMLAVDNT